MIFAMKCRLLSDQVLGRDSQTSQIECLSQCWVFFSLYVSLPRLAACFILILISHLLFDGHYSRRWEQSTELNRIPALMELTWKNRKSGKGSWGGCQIQDGWSEEVSLKWHWSKDLQVTREWRLTTWGVKESTQARGTEWEEGWRLSQQGGIWSKWGQGGMRSDGVE